MSKIIIAYIGEDEFYLSSIKLAFKKNFPHKEVDFVSLEERSPQKIKSIAKKIFALGPHIILIDMEKNLKSKMTLAQFLSKHEPLRIVPLLALLGPSIEKEDRVKVSLIGIDALQLKTIDHNDIVFNSLFLLDQKAAPMPQLATVDTVIKMEANLFCRIGFSTSDYLHVETNASWDVNDIVELNTNFEGDFPINHFKVIRNLEQNFYYHYRKSYDLEYCYDLPAHDSIWGRLPLPVDVEEEQDKQKSLAPKGLQKASYSFGTDDAAIREAKRKKVLKWSKFNQDEQSKRTRVLVIDKEMNILDQTKKELDEYPFSFAVHTQLNPEHSLVKRIMPGIIVYVLGGKSIQKVSTKKTTTKKTQKESSEEDNPETDNDNLTLLFDEIKNINHYHPFIVFFNASNTNTFYQERCGYNSIQAISHGFDLELVVQFADLFQSHSAREKTYDQNFSFYKREKREYYSKHAPRSWAAINFEFKFLRITELYGIIEVKDELPNLGIIHLQKKMRMTMTVLANRKVDLPPTTKGHFVYFVIFHGLSEKKKAALRVFVNNEKARLEEERNLAKKKN